MNFKLSFTYSYDPLGIISKLRVEQKTTPYAHTLRPKIEHYANQDEWIENTLQEAKEQIISHTSLQTPISKDKEAKKSRESMYSIDSSSQAANFHVFKRRKKTNLKANTKTNTKNDT